FRTLLTAVALLSCYSIHLLLKASGVLGIRAYEQLGFRAFGTPGKMAAAIAITLQNIGAMSSYLYIVKYELPLVLQAFLHIQEKSGEWYLNGNYLVVIVSASIILPLALMKQLGYLGYTSGFSLSCMVFFLIAVIYKKFQIPCPLLDGHTNSTLADNSTFLLEHTVVYDNGENTVIQDSVDSACGPRMMTLKTQVRLPVTKGRIDLHWSQSHTGLGYSMHHFQFSDQTAYTIPILAFAFVCHPEVLPIYTELKEPGKKKTKHVFNICTILLFLCGYALFLLFFFYRNVEPELLHTYSRVDPFDTLILCVRVAVLIAVTLTVPIVLFPVRRAIQQMLFVNKGFSWLRHFLIAIVLLSFINLLVIFAPNILDIFGIIGATSAPCLIFIFPAIFYIRIMPKEEEPMKSTPKILATCFACLGVLFMTMSLSFIIIDWTTGDGGMKGG
uniref:Solute carrier family 38 member 3b n=1 Tax=Latimeria chalumnae TaxID=7897 RepID=H3B1W9_LATCH